VSVSVYDRLCRLAVDYQSEEEETEIVLRRTRADRDLARTAVRVVRRTRRHPALRSGCSVRGAIDLVLLVAALRDLGGGAEHDDLGAAAELALSSKVVVDQAHGGTAEEAIGEILADVTGAPADVVPRS
jgi:MoxR-like ATPase